MPDLKTYIPEDLATILPMQPPTVRKLLRSGQLRGIKVGARKWIVTEAALMAYLNGEKGGQS